MGFSPFKKNTHQIGFSQNLILYFEIMAFIKIYIHLVFSTLQRKPLLNSKELRIKVWKHIKENAKEKEIFSGYG